MKELGLKARVFIYYLRNVEGNQTTNKFHIDFASETEKAKYMEAAKAKLVAERGERFVKMFRCFVKADAEIMLDNDALKARDWLIENGYLFQLETKKHDGQMTIFHTGVTAKGWEVAPKYVRKVCSLHEKCGGCPFEKYC